MLVDSVPLSETIVHDLPRSAMTRHSSRVTRRPKKDVPATSAGFPACDHPP